jgi:Domain of unknown function (DUF6894)
MRYYFHVMGVDEEYRDLEGVVCMNAYEAEGHARLMANELVWLLDDFCDDESLTTLSVLVTDERGNEVTSAPLQGGQQWRH